MTVKTPKLWQKAVVQWMNELIVKDGSDAILGLGRLSIKRETLLKGAQVAESKREAGKPLLTLYTS